MRKLGFVAFFLLGCLSAFGQVNPNTFTEETDPNNANFEFYSQKSDSTRRATFNNVRKGMVLSINHTRQTAPTDTTGLMTNLMSFYKTAGDTIYVQDGAGNAFLLYDPTLNLQSVIFSGDTLYIEDADPVDLSAINTDSQAIDSAWVSGDSIYLSVSGDGVAAFGFDVSGISGSGGASSGSNGVTVAAGIASLSVDTLSADVEYTTRGASSGNFQIKPYTNSNNIQFLSNESVITIGSNRAYYIFADTFLNEYIQANGTRTIYDLRTTTTGIEYADDYSDDYSERSLVDRGYIDERIDPITTLINDGINLSYNAVSELLSSTASSGSILTVQGYSASQRNGVYMYEVVDTFDVGLSIDSLSIIPMANGKYARYRPYGNMVLASAFGVDTSNADNSGYTQKMYEFAKFNGYGMLFDVPGTYKFEGTAMDDNGDASWDIYIEAVDGVVFEELVKGELIFRLKNENIGGSYSLLGAQERGQAQLKFTSTSGLGPGDIITIESDSLVTGLGVRKADVVEIDYVLNDSVVIIKDSLLFSYEDGESMNFIRIHKYHTLTIKNVDIRQNFDNLSTTGDGAGLFWGFNNVLFEDIYISSDTLFESSVNDGFTVTHCANVYGNRLRFENHRYGWLVNYALNYTMENVMIEHSRHLMASSTWSRNLRVENVRSYKTGTPIESHYAWNVTFINVQCHQEGDLNIRAFGVIRMEDCYIEAETCPTCSSYSLIGYHFARNALDTSFIYLVDNTHIRLDNVVYIDNIGGESGKFKGLTANSFQTFTANNCVSPNIGAYDNSRLANGVQVNISNSVLGQSYLQSSGDEKVRFDNCLFDRDYFDNYGGFASVNGSEWLVSLDAGTSVHFDGCEFVGTDSVDLNSAWILSGEKAYFNDCIGANFKDLATSYTYANNLPYEYILTANNTDVVFLQPSFMDSVAVTAGAFQDSVDFSTSIQTINEGSVSFSDITIEGFNKDDGDQIYNFPIRTGRDVRIHSFTGQSGNEVNGIDFGTSNIGYIGRDGDDLEIKSRDDINLYSGNGGLVFDIRAGTTTYYRLNNIFDSGNATTSPSWLPSFFNDGAILRWSLDTIDEFPGSVGGSDNILSGESGSNNHYALRVDSLFKDRNISGETEFSGALYETNKRDVSVSSDTLTVSDYIIYVDASGGAVDIYLPDAATNDGQVYIIHAVDASNTITISALSGNVNGAASVTINSSYDYYEIHCHSGNYYARQ